MTIPMLFLLGAFGLSVVLAIIVWLVSRPRKQKFGSSIDSFNNDLAALAPKRDIRRNYSSNYSSNQSLSRATGVRPKPGPRPRS